MNAIDPLRTGKNAVKLISGNHACALGAIAAGCRFFAGYPITPSSEIAERLARRLPEVDGVFVQMEDEIASIAAVIGASNASLLPEFFRSSSSGSCSSARVFAPRFLQTPPRGDALALR